MPNTRKRALQSKKTSRLTKKNLRAVRFFSLFTRIQRIGVAMSIFGVILILFAYATPAVTTIIDRYQKAGPRTREPIRPDNAFSIAATGKSPIRIVIPDVSIDVSVIPAPLVNGYWQVSEKAASFGLGSAPPGSTGNTVIFAHARDALFLPLKDVKPKARIYLFTDTQWYAYEVETVTEVWPNDTYVISPTREKKLTLFTCSGFFDSKRLVVAAKPM